jgi:uncharacterized protein with HEPN domain
MLDEDRVRIGHMLDAAEEVVGFVSGRQRSDLDGDRMLLFAVVRGIEIIGEAAAKVSAETRELSPAIPWAAIISMRHRLVHGYFDVDPDIVWRTATEEVLALIPPLRDLAAPG